MRKALIGIAVATALFAVGAFAASFTVNSEDIASGSNPTASCTSGATVDFNELWVPASQNWVVEDITVTLADAATCVTADVQLVVQDDADAVVLDQTKPNVPAANVDGDLILTYTPVGTLTVAQVWNSAVLIDNLYIPNQT